MMEIEKPFKCTVCGANFTNEDHLQVHRRKHEMSLALGKTSSQSSSNALESFTDETPTPTRFFQNCEEVGLFQDLQSVNPFDEQFSKATTSSVSNASNTPGTRDNNNGSDVNEGHHLDHHHESFDFSLAISSTTSASTSVSNNVSSSGGNNNNENACQASSNRRRYSDQDTLNTPQVFGYIVNATSSTTNTCSTSSVLTPMPPTTTALVESPNNPGKHLIKGDEIPEESKQGAIDKGIRNAPTSASILVKNMSNRNKTNLKLNLSPNVTPLSTIPSSNGESIDRSKSKKSRLIPEKKAELLERNRAAAVRSRERRKKWVSSLESKCETYEMTIAQLKSQVARQNNEIELLKSELSKHADCDVTKRSIPSSSSTAQPLQLYVQHPLPTQQPNILRSQVSVPVVVAAISSASTTSEHVFVGTKSKDSSPFMPIVTNVPNRVKRGRPRRGEERRVDIVSVPASSSPGIPLKIRLVPLHRSRPQIKDTSSSSANTIL